MSGHDPVRHDAPNTTDGTVELERYPDGSRLVRPDSDKATGQHPPEEIDGTADDGVAETTTGDRGGTS